MYNCHTWLHNEKIDYLVEWRHCNKIQICFGNLLLSCDSAAFEKSGLFFEQNLRNNITWQRMHLKTIVLPHPLLVQVLY